MKINVLLLPLLLILLPIPVPVPRPLPTWHMKKLTVDGVYLNELIKRFGVNRRIQPQDSTGGSDHADLGPPRHDVLSKL